MQYELFYLVGASKEAELEDIKKEVADIVISEGGVFQEKQVVEKRKMSYKIKRETHGAYIAQRFDLEDPQKIQEINRKLNLYGKILRFIISRTEELPELMTKEERIAREQSASRFEPKKEEPVKKEIEAKEEKPIEEKKETAGGEDIDKKLEEILNI